MKQWVIDRYNKGQDKYKFEIGLSDETVWLIDINDERNAIKLYDFLFNPKWGFAKTMWFNNKKEIYYGWEENEKGKEFILSWQYHLQQMAIADDVLEYLEKFK